MKDEKVPDSPAKKVVTPVKSKAAENGSAKPEEEDDEVKENGASEEEEEDDDEVVEKEQNGDTKGLFKRIWYIQICNFIKIQLTNFYKFILDDEEETDSCQKGVKRKSGASEAAAESEDSEKKAKLEEAEEDPATAEPQFVEA